MSVVGLWHSKSAPVLRKRITVTINNMNNNGNDKKRLNVS